MTTSPAKRLTEYANCAGCAGKIPPLGIAQILRADVTGERDPQTFHGDVRLPWFPLAPGGATPPGLGRAAPKPTRDSMAPLGLD